MARAIRRCGRCSSARSSAFRSRRSPSSGATPTWCPRAAAPAARAPSSSAAAAPRELLDVARERAAAALEAAPADLEYHVETSTFSVKGDPDVSVPLTSLAESERLFVRSVFTAPGPTFPFG